MSNILVLSLSVIGILLALFGVVCAIVFLAAIIGRRGHLGQLPFLRPETPAPAAEPVPAAPATNLPILLVDTSVIIDGRIADIATAGFVPGRLVVPRFVLAELQNIADSDDAMRRGRGRRGLDVLNRLRELPDVSVEIIEDDVANVREVDAKLVVLAQKFSCDVLTTDYNLNRVAQIQGVRVLNVNELSNAIRPVVLPGEELIVRVVQPGKERNQGVGYLADGTMIVVENGDKMIGQEVSTEVTRVFQTVAGKMIFATPRHAVVVSPPAPTPAPVPTHEPAPAVTPPTASTPPVPAISAPAAPVTPVTPVAPATPHPAPHQASTNGNNGSNHRQRFNRNRGNNNNNKPAATRPVKTGAIEDRIIAATNHPQAPAPRPHQPNQAPRP